MEGTKFLFAETVNYNNFTDEWNYKTTYHKHTISNTKRKKILTPIFLINFSQQFQNLHADFYKSFLYNILYNMKEVHLVNEELSHGNGMDMCSANAKQMKLVDTRMTIPFEMNDAF